MRYEPFRNLFVTPVLPFNDDGEIDEPAYRAFLRRFLTPAAQGAGMALIANPEAGELFTLDREERRRVVRIVLAALSPLEAARQADLGAYDGWTDPERVVGNLHRAYLELAGGDRGAPLDVTAALRDMVAYNGGRPLTCHA